MAGVGEPVKDFVSERQAIVNPPLRPPSFPMRQDDLQFGYA